MGGQYPNGLVAITQFLLESLDTVAQQFLVAFRLFGRNGGRSGWGSIQVRRHVRNDGLPSVEFLSQARHLLTQ